jgi:ribonuclease HI
MHKRLKIYIDGASKGNPGEAGAGILIIDEKDKVIKEFSEYLGSCSNNVAEYKAFLIALKMAIRLQAEYIVIYCDSELLVRQIKGIYRVKNSYLKSLYTKAIELLKNFNYYEIIHIKREANHIADKLANKAIKEKNQKR